MWVHFSYTSGGNPYIAFNEDVVKKIIRKYKRKRIDVELIKPGFYLVHDKEARI